MVNYFKVKLINILYNNKMTKEGDENIGTRCKYNENSLKG